MSIFSQSPKRIETKIKQLKRSLQQQKARFGGYDDSGGARYLLGPLYLCAGDLTGALRSFNWFAKTFPDDMGEPGQYLCWTLLLFKKKRLAEATRKLQKTMLMNLYLIPHLLGMEPPQYDIWHGSSWDMPDYVQYVPPEFFALWDAEALAWAREQYESPHFVQVRTRYVEIYGLLKNERDVSRRTPLVREAYALRYDQ